MVPSVKKKWLKALRSGKYKQGRGALCKKTKDNFEFCCFGVLCDVIGVKWTKSILDGELMCPSNSVRSIGIDNIRDVEWVKFTSMYITTELREKLQIESINENQLIKMNDKGKKFSEIANWIEKHL